MNQDNLKEFLSKLDSSGKQKLSQLMMDMIKNRSKELDELPLCHKIYHPFLGGIFKDTCPECGWKKNDKVDR